MCYIECHKTLILLRCPIRMKYCGGLRFAPCKMGSLYASERARICKQTELASEATRPRTLLRTKE